MHEITKELNKPYESLPRPPDLEALDLSIINDPANQRKPLFECEDTPYSSKFEEKCIDTKDLLIKVSPIPFGKSSGSKIYLKLHAYTLAPIAVGKIDPPPPLLVNITFIFTFTFT